MSIILLDAHTHTTHTAGNKQMGIMASTHSSLFSNRFLRRFFINVLCYHWGVFVFGEGTETDTDRTEPGHTQRDSFILIMAFLGL